VSEGRRADPALVATALLLAAHVGLVLHFTPRGFLSMPAPFLTSTFALEAYRADRALRALEATGHFSTYDPQVLAGQVAGVWEPLGTRALALLTLLATRLHVELSRAQCAVAVSLHALLPVAGYFAARASGRSRKVAAVVVAAWSLLTFFDALTHYAWFSGRISFALACAVVVLEMASVDRALAERRIRWVVAAAVAATVCVLLHPLPALLGAAAVVVTAARSSVPPRLRVMAFLPALLPVAMVVALNGSGVATSEPLASVFHVGPSSAFWDLLEIPGPGYGAAGSSRTSLRVLCIGAGWLAWYRGHRRFGAVETLAAAALAVAYLGALLPIAWPIDPYFFAIAAVFAATLPAADLVASIQWSELVRGAPAGARAALLVVAVIAVPRAARTVLTYAPELLPERHVRGPSDLAVSALGGINEPFPDPLGYDPPPARLNALAVHLQREDASGGRVLTDDAAVAGFLALRTSLPVLGPLGERGAPASVADPTPLLEGRAGAGSIADFVDRYGVAFVVLAGRPGPFDAADPHFAAAVDVAGYRVRRVAQPTSIVARGEARVEPSTRGSVRVSGAVGPRVTLRYHYAPGLACRPHCRVEMDPQSGDGLGFVSVPNPPAAFEIFSP
jgi:hypothetical protein